LFAQARAKELVDAALDGRNPASITRVRLSNKSYTAEAARVIGKALEAMTNVTEVRTRWYTSTPQASMPVGLENRQQKSFLCCGTNFWDENKKSAVSGPSFPLDAVVRSKGLVQS